MVRPVRYCNIYFCFYSFNLLVITVLQYIFLFLFIQSTRHLRPSKINTHTHTTTHDTIIFIINLFCFSTQCLCRTKKENVKKTSQQIKKLRTQHTRRGKDTKTNSKITSTNM